MRHQTDVPVIAAAVDQEQLGGWVSDKKEKRYENREQSRKGIGTGRINYKDLPSRRSSRGSSFPRAELQNLT
jgi:hypothetical protein